MLQPLLATTAYAAIGFIASAALRPLWWMNASKVLPSSHSGPSWWQPLALVPFVSDFLIALAVGIGIGHSARTNRPELWGLYGGSALTLSTGLLTGSLKFGDDVNGWTFFWAYLPAVLIASITVLTAERVNRRRRIRADVA